MVSLLAKIFLAAIVAGSARALPASISATASYKSSASTPSPSSSVAATPTDFTGLIADLKVEPSSLKRFQKLLLGGDGAVLPWNSLREKVVFSFKDKASAAKGANGGTTAAANIETFPILTNLGIATTVAFLDKCGMNTPHIHPRATEFLTVVDGEIDFGYILENNFAKKAGTSNEVNGTLKTFEGTVFPMGSIHYQFNRQCEPATFVATLNSEDPGTSQIAQNFFGLNSQVVNVTLGYPQSIDGSNIDEFRTKLPANLVQAIDDCLAGCKKIGSSAY